MEISSLAKLSVFAKQVLEIIEMKHENSAVVLALSGELGAGKTTFVKKIAKHLDVSQNILSPTFSIMKVYSTQNKKFKQLIHIDAYRLQSARDLEILDIRSYIEERSNIIVIEWPENVKGIVPSDAIKLQFRNINEKTRNITFN